MAIVRTVDGEYITTGNSVRAQLYMNYAGQIGICGCAFKCTSDTGFGIAAGEFAEVIQNGVDGELQALLNTVVNILGCKVSFLPPNQLLGAGIATSTSIGSTGGDILPTQTSGIVTLKTKRSGRSGRGRFYVPFPDTTMLDADGTPVASYVTKLNNLRDQFVKTFTIVGISGNATLVPVVYHRATSTTDPITSAFGKKLWATQRRRGDFGHLNAPVIT